jgi:hypothetical protein
MCKTGKLFRSSITGSTLWDCYLKNFMNKDNPIFRDPESSTHNCNLCNNFIRRYGNIVAIDENNKLMSIWDIEASEEYESSCKAMSNLLRNNPIQDVFFETFNELNSLPYEKTTKQNNQFKLGIDKNVKRYTKEEAEKFGVVKPNEIRTFNHFYLMLPKEFVDMTGKSVESIMGEFRDAKNVFKRAMDEISLDTLMLVRDLINQGSLLDGATHLDKVERISIFKQRYDTIENSKKDNWCWKVSYKLTISKFRNELIGTLCAELSQGMELNKACENWNKRVDPINYMKAKAPITQKQIKEAQKFVEENGYEESFIRRCATIDDIKASEILHLNSGNGEIPKVSIFDNIKATSTRHKRSEFDKVEEVTIDKFMKDILPSCTSVEAFLLNSHVDNMVTLTTANNKDSKNIFKWNNNYSWTFNGNLAGKSLIKDAVKKRGGKTEGCINIRLHFPNTISDYDLQVIEPQEYLIYYSNRRKLSPCFGMLDLDAQGCDGNFPPEERVENVIFTDKSKLKNGDYKVLVSNYLQKDSNYGFTLEVETSNGEVVTFNYNKYFRQGSKIDVCTIRVKDGEIEIIPILPISDSNSISQKLYNLETNNFHKVSLVCLSPNHWNDNKVGNKHYFFMLEGCKAPDNIRSFHNENLKSELLDHRKVMEVLSATTMVESTDKQLSGLGFNATIRDEVILRLKGTHNRIIKVKF